MPHHPTSDNPPAASIPLRMPLHPDIDEDMIERLVRRFYDRVRDDAQLAPIFARVIPGDWEPHLQVMMAFWSSVTLMTGRFKGQPMIKHQALFDAGPEHFVRWIALFHETAREVCPPDVADIFIDRAKRIAATLSQGMFGEPYLAATTRT